ncbi:MAG: glycosyltransferase family A protein [Fimbriimonadaceae bacterium]
MALRIGIVIPCYTGERYVAEAIGSAQAVLEPGDVLVVVDDGSTDSTADVIRRVVARGPSDQCDFVWQENGGVSKARNRGAEEATSRGAEALLFLDSDDVLVAKGVQTARERLSQVQEAVAVGGQHVELRDGRATGDAVGRTGWRKDYVARHGFPEDRITVRECFFWCPFVTPGCVLVKTEDFARAGGFPEGIQWGEDHELWMKRSRLGVVLSVDQPIVQYRIHGNSFTHSNQRLLKFERNIRARRAGIKFAKTISVKLASEASKGARDNALWGVRHDLSSAGQNLAKGKVGPAGLSMGAGLAHLSAYIFFGLEALRAEVRACLTAL